MDIAALSPTYAKMVGHIDRSIKSLLQTGFVELLLPEITDGNWRQHWR